MADPILAEPVIASYNYTDIAAGSGYVVYYGYNEKLSGAIENFRLTSTPIFSYNIEASGASTPAYTRLKDLDFDVTFSMPQRVKGFVKFVIPYHTAGGGSPQAFFRVYFRKWDGTTESTIGMVESNTIDATEGAYKVLNLALEISQVVHFKKGETMRITVEMWGLSNPASTHAFYFDPQDRNGWDVSVGSTIGTTKFQVYVPFIIDL